MVKRLAALWAKRKVCWILVKRDLRVRYARSVLGYVWSVVEPLANALIYFVLFGFIFVTTTDPGHSPYFLFLLVGLLPWQWFNNSVTDSTRALLQEWRLVKSANLPREIWVVRLVIAKGIEFLLSLPVLVFFFAIFAVLGQARLNPLIALFPVAMAIQFLMQVGIGLILAPVTVMVNDVQPLVRIFLRVFFYLCPVIFRLDLVQKPGIPAIVRDIYTYNPFSGVLELYRAGFFEAPINWVSVASALIGTTVFLVVGAWVFTRLERAVLKEI